MSLTSETLSEFLKTLFAAVITGFLGYLLAAFKKASTADLIDLERRMEAKLRERQALVIEPLKQQLAVIEAGREPAPSEVQALAARVRGPVTGAWWNEIILVAQNTALRMVAQSRMTPQQAWTDTADIVAEIHATNQAQLAK